MTEIVDFTDECCKAGNRPKRRTRETDLIVVHRFGPTIPDWHEVDTAIDIAEAFAEHPGLQAIGRMPYHFVVFQDGTIDQAVPLIYRTPHARQYNSRSVAVAVHGDFRRNYITPMQWSGLEDLCSALRILHPRAQVAGHTDLPNGSNDPDKQCPGPNLDVGRLHLRSLAIALSKDPHIYSLSKSVIL